MMGVCVRVRVCCDEIGLKLEVAGGVMVIWGELGVRGVVEL